MPFFFSPSSTSSSSSSAFRLPSLFPLRLSLQPLMLHRSSSASTELLQDMPHTPTREAAALQLFPTPTISTQHQLPPPPPPPAAHSSTSSYFFSSSSAPSPSSSSTPSSSSSSPSAVPTVTTAVSLRGWLTALVLPCFAHKTTRLLLSLILATCSLILLYFTAFSFYLTHFLAGSDDSSSSSCATFPLSLFLVFVFFRSLCDVLLVCIRMREPSMWINQRVQMQRHQRFFHLIHLVLYATSAAFLCFGFTWLGSSAASSCVALSKPLVAAVLAWELLSVLVPLSLLACLSSLFPLRSLSLFCPWIPLTSDTFAASGEQVGLSRSEIERLPSFVYTQGRWTDDDRKCSICLCDVEVGEKVRQLDCQHHFHQPCLDSWVAQRATCPLCVRKVSAGRASKLRQWRLHLSRTRTDSTRHNTSATHSELSVSRSTAQAEAARSELEEDQALEMV